MQCPGASTRIPHTQLISELPNDEAVARLALANAAMGTVRTETLRAFTEDEHRKILAALP